MKLGVLAHRVKPRRRPGDQKFKLADLGYRDPGLKERKKEKGTEKGRNGERRERGSELPHSGTHLPSTSKGLGSISNITSEQKTSHQK